MAPATFAPMKLSVCMSNAELRVGGQEEIIKMKFDTSVSDGCSPPASIWSKYGGECLSEDDPHVEMWSRESHIVQQCIYEGLQYIVFFSYSCYFLFL